MLILLNGLHVVVKGYHEAFLLTNRPVALFDRSKALYNALRISLHGTRFIETNNEHHSISENQPVFIVQAQRINPSRHRTVSEKFVIQEVSSSDGYKRI